LARPSEGFTAYVLCHSDIHAGNVLIGANGSFHIVDWDDPILAPKERDLMYVGAGIGGIWNEAREEALFYGGYGRMDIDPIALAYYRHERIVEDIAIFCRQIFLSQDGGADREQALEHMRSNFLPGHTIDMARRSLTLSPSSIFGSDNK
jgi:spectinomycin phosphotransferase